MEFFLLQPHGSCVSHSDAILKWLTAILDSLVRKLFYARFIEHLHTVCLFALSALNGEKENESNAHILLFRNITINLNSFTIYYFLPGVVSNSPFII